MGKRELLQELIELFEVQKFIRFLSAANSAFKPVTEDYSHYLDSEGYFSDFNKEGHIEFKDGGQLLVCTIFCDKPLTERTGKKKQYDLAKKVLKDTFCEAGLFLFYDNNGRFRLSFICAQYMGPKRLFSMYRRYTYFVSAELFNKTFINQVGKCDFSSVDSILEVFSIEAVSQDFYDEFKPRFDKIAATVTGLPDINSQLREDFALLFAIRTIFLGFVQKKGWLGGNEQFLQCFWNEYKSRFSGKDEFYDRWLIPLFFEALNSAPGQKVQWHNNDFSKEIEAVLQMAPFFNGELFKRKSGVDDLELSLPDIVIGDFIEWLFRYNFTIEENDLYDEELELNPEFLGIIFERLVNKADGAVYTPRTEVDLMCRLALLNWLDKNSSVEKSELYHQFFREGGEGIEFDEDQKEGNFSTNEIRELVSLLESVTLCDPAAGSGAFEVGMLHIIDETLESLYRNPKCPPDIQQKNAFERKKAIIGQSLYGVEVKRWAVWINQLRLWLTLFIDMPGDMKNSLTPLLPSLNFKIRRGDSIVQRIGGKMFPVHGETDLPKAIKEKIDELKKEKIDFYYNRGKDEKYIHGLETQVFKKIVDSQIKSKQRKFDSIQKPHKQLGFDKSESEQKHLLELAKFEKKRNELTAEIEELTAEYSNLSEEHPLIWNIEFSEIFYDRGGFDIIIGNPPYVRQEDIADPDGNVEPKTYKELLQGTMRIDFPKHFKNSVKIDGKSDLYTFFYLRSLHLLNEKGVHVFICSNSWLDVGYGVWMQEFLLNNVPVRYIIDNHARRSFATSDINTIISVMDAPLRKGIVPDGHIVKFIAFKKPFEQCIFTEKLLELEHANNIIKNDTFRVYPITKSQLYDEGWEIEEGAKKESGLYVGDKWGGKYLRAPDIFFTILQKGKGKLVKLKYIAKVLPGCYSGINDFFYITKNEIDEFKIDKEYLTSLLRSSNDINMLKFENKQSHFVLSIKPISKDRVKKNTRQYINWGEMQVTRKRQKTAAGIPWPQTTTVANRKYWYSIPPKNLLSTQLFMQYVANDRFYCPFSQKAIVSDRCFHRIFPKIESDFNFLVTILNSTFQTFLVMLLGRANLGQGALKFEAKDANNIITLKTSEISRQGLNKLVDKIGCHKPVSIYQECGLDPESDIPLSEQEPKPLPDRKELDDIIFDALDLTQDERKEVYRAVCQLVWNRLSKAKSVKKRK